MNLAKFLSLAVLTSTSAVSVQAAEYTVDPSHSSVSFTVHHLVGKVKGSFKNFDGTFNFDPKKPSDATGKFDIKAASINTDNQKRDEHLKSPDFFDVKKFPALKMDNIKISPASGENKYKMVGDLTMHGVTKPVSFDLEYNGEAKDPWGNTRGGFTATGVLNRKDYAINWNKTLDTGGVMLGDDVAVELQMEAIQGKPKASKKD